MYFERKEIDDFIPGFLEWLSFTDNKGGFENVLEEITELRREVSYQNDYISSMADPFKRRGYWYFMPPPPSSKVGLWCWECTLNKV